MKCVVNQCTHARTHACTHTHTHAHSQFSDELNGGPLESGMQQIIFVFHFHSAGIKIKHTISDRLAAWS